MGRGGAVSRLREGGRVAYSENVEVALLEMRPRGGGRDVTSPGIEAVARWLCTQSEYMDANWRLYTGKAQGVIDAYLKATK